MAGSWSTITGSDGNVGTTVNDSLVTGTLTVYESAPQT